MFAWIGKVIRQWIAEETAELHRPVYALPPVPALVGSPALIARATPIRDEALAWIVQLGTAAPHAWNVLMSRTDASWWCGLESPDWQLLTHRLHQAALRRQAERAHTPGGPSEAHRWAALDALEASLWKVPE